MKCQICNSKLSKIMDGITQCDNCMHIYRNVRFDKNYYISGEYRKIHAKKDVALRQKWVRNILGWCSDTLNQCNKILEIGSGDGLLSLELINSGKSLISCELDPIISKNYTWKNYTGDFTELCINDTIDLTIMCDIIEHVPNIDSFFQKITSKYILGQVPINRKIKPLSSNDSHCHYFTYKSLELCVIKHNMSIVKYYLTPPDFSANGPELLFLIERNSIIGTIN